MKYRFIYQKIASVCVKALLGFPFVVWPGMLPRGQLLAKVNNRNTRIRCEICSKLTIKTPECCQ